MGTSWISRKGGFLEKRRGYDPSYELWLIFPQGAGVTVKLPSDFKNLIMKTFFCETTEFFCFFSNDFLKIYSNADRPLPEQTGQIKTAIL